MTTIEEPTTPDGSAKFGVKLTAVLPKGDANGLRHWAQLLANHPKDRRYAVIMFDTARVIDDLDRDVDTAVIRLLRIEVAGAGLTGNAQDLMLAAAEARGVDPSLFDDEDGNDE